MLQETKQVDTAHDDTGHTQHSSTEKTVGYFIPTEEQAVASNETAPFSHSFSELGALTARRAYQLYENRGRQDGHNLDDWLEAERQILAQFAKLLTRKLGHLQNSAGHRSSS